MTEESSFVRKEPCPECGSRDNLARYSDGHAYCFGCGHYEHGDGSVSQPPKHSKGHRMENALKGEFKALPKRGLTEETCRKFGYMVGKDKHGKTVQIAPYYNAEGKLVAQKLRDAEKNFTCVGNMKEAVLFGQHLWPSGGRRVVITEGEIDCMTVSQLQGHKWPVVSVQNGADGAARSIKQNLQWLNTFEEVVLVFDQDEPKTKKDGTVFYPGQDAARECVTLFPPGKCKIAVLPGKDPNALLVAGEGEKVIQAIWNAQTYRPDGIVTIADIRDAVLKPAEWGLPWFLEDLTKLTYGRRYGEIYAFGAGTGVGKTDFLTQQVDYDINTLKVPVALFFMEQQPVETIRRVAGKFAGKRFHVPDAGWTADQLSEAIQQLEASGKLYLYDNFGATEWERIRETIRFLAHSEGVRIFYVDHLTALAAAEEDERKALEAIMAEMGALVKELDIMILLVSHLATPEGRPHEEGGRVMIRHFKGSRAIGFWCHYMFGLERDQQHENEVVRSTTTFRVLKDRYTGQATGQVIYLGYDVETGRLFKTEKPEDTPFSDETSSSDEDAPF